LFYGLQVLTIKVCDSHITGRPAVGYVKFPLTRMPQDGCLTAWLPVQVQHSSEVYTIGMKATMMGYGKIIFLSSTDMMRHSLRPVHLTAAASKMN